MTKRFFNKGEHLVTTNLSYKYTINTVKNAIKILKTFTKENKKWTLTEISNQLNLNISNSQRLLNTLHENDYLRRDPQTKEYELGYMILNLSGIIKTTMEVYQEAHPILQDLAEELDNAIHLGVLEGTKIVYLNKLEAKHPLRLNSHVGIRKPAYCTACGKIMLAYQNKEKQSSLLEEIEQDGFVRYGKNTVTSSEQLSQQLKEIKSVGFSVCIDDFSGVVSIAAPIRDYTDDVIAAVSVTSEVYKINDEDLPFYIEHIVNGANKISEKLGYYG